MELKDFYYELPEELIAQDPLKDRASSRLMVLRRESGEIKHRHFQDIAEYLKSGDCLTLNDTEVIPARLIGGKVGAGAKIEMLLLARKESRTWETLVKPGRKCLIDTKISFGEGELVGEIVGQTEGGNRFMRFSYEDVFEEILDGLGQMPLPPYIHHQLKDKDRYQTVYAAHEGGAATSTTGLHFTEALLKSLKEKGVIIARITLHAGLGTFRPVKEQDILKHYMHEEFYVVSEEAAETVNRAKMTGGRIVCVNTTSCRTLESAASEDGTFRTESGYTRISIYPGYRFRILNCLATNFRLPESILVMLVNALAGREKILNVYREAAQERYRFFSFGDAMLIE